MIITSNCTNQKEVFHEDLLFVLQVIVSIVQNRLPENFLR